MTRPGEANQEPNKHAVDPTVVHDPSTIIVEHNPKDPNSPEYRDPNAVEGDTTTVVRLDTPPPAGPVDAGTPKP